MENKKWVPLLGVFEWSDKDILFKGEPTKWVDPNDPTGTEKVGYAPGLIISNHRFNGGTVSADISFDTVNPSTSCELVFYFDSARQTFLSAGITPTGFTIRQWDAKTSTNYAQSGDRRNLQPRHSQGDSYWRRFECDRPAGATERTERVRIYT